ncbi:unnamed protein product [Orchesella dallaii]|uniref:G-protein coupled receptors family 1 profile domain-containing protein n=1 Tax=Orchesella dallaii TaxID=48710 RepID=A0ABP1PR56_9HEXA
MYTAASGPLQLDFWTCFFLDEKLNSTFETGDRNLSGDNVYCKAYGRYLGGIDSQSIVIGHITCVAICTVIFLICVCGVLANTLNIILLRRSITQGSLKDLLLVLAVIELLGCLSAMIYSYVIVNILENLDRSKPVFQCFRISNIIFSVCRSASVYVTILITIERCLVVAFPMKSKLWLEPTKSLSYLLFALTISLVLNLPWILTSTVAKNDNFLAPNSTLEYFPYIFKDIHRVESQVFVNLLPPKLQEALIVLNYVAPFPLLLIFNLMLHKSIYLWNKRRARFSSNHHEINAAKMFSVVVLILLSCHTISCVIFYTSRFKEVIFRELMLVQLLCVAFGGTANFMVYYLFSQGFKEEFWKLTGVKRVII